MPSITWQGREVTNPYLRPLVAVGVSLWVVAGVTVLIVAVGLMLALWPIWLPLDYVLRHTGRRGFVRFSSDGLIALKFTPEAFRRV